MSQPKFSVHHKIWFNLEIDGNSIPFLGENKIELLKAIQTTGSIRDAAEAMEMDYHKAWDMIETMQEKIQQDMITTTRGRKGGSQLTLLATLIVSEYDKINNTIRQQIDEFHQPLEDENQH